MEQHDRNSLACVESLAPNAIDNGAQAGRWKAEAERWKAEAERWKAEAERWKAEAEKSKNENARICEKVAQAREEVAQIRAEIAQQSKQISELQSESNYSREKYERVQSMQRRAAATDVPGTDEDRAAHEVFAAWQRLFGYGKETLTKARRAVILARLRDGHTVEQIIQVLTWASTDPWTRGRAAKSTRAYDDLTNILSATKFDERLLRATNGSGSLTKSAKLLGGQGKPTTIRVLGTS